MAIGTQVFCVDTAHHDIAKDGIIARCFRDGASCYEEC